MTSIGKRKALVAQWKERRPPKAETAGSSPAGGTGSGSCRFHLALARPAPFANHNLRPGMSLGGGCGFS